MLRASSLASISKSNPFTQESGMSHVATDTNWAVREFADAELGDERRTKRLVELANVLGQQVWARDPNDVGKRVRRKHLPISQKESQKWLHSLDAVYTARDCCPTTRLVSVGDREADVYDVLAAARPEGVDLLIRASWDRCVGGPEHYVWATVAAQPVIEHLLLQVPRRGPQAARDATLALRFGPLTRCPPRHRQREGLPAVTLWAVQVQEVEPPT